MRKILLHELHGLIDQIEEFQNNCHEMDGDTVYKCFERLICTTKLIREIAYKMPLDVKEEKKCNGV